MGYACLRKLLFCLPPELAHHLAIKALSLRPAFLCRAKPMAGEGVTLMGLHFANRVGLAAGLDKDARAVHGFGALGFGFVEVGTLTPKPQAGNPKPRLFRLPKVQAVINRMGFNNSGIEAACRRLAKRRYKGVLGVNIGKNKNTPNDQALSDYIFGMKKAYPFADYIAVNISSPNTPGLRTLQNKEELESLLLGLKACQRELQVQYQRYVPLVVKLSPDMSTEQIIEAAQVLLSCKIDGVIATNTTISRPIPASSDIKETGGLSGAPLKTLSTQTIKALRRALGDEMPIIGVGGIMSLADAQEKRDAGADLVQLYTGLIYKGPALIKEIGQLK